MSKGRIHSIESMGTLDGPGLRTVFFMQGCNMRCLYCHNRDSWDPRSGREISVDEILESAASYKSYYGMSGGVTFSGGEPLLQSSFLLQAVNKLKKEGIHTAVDTSGSLFSRDTRELFDAVDLVILDIKHSNSYRFRELCGLPIENLRRNLEYLQKGGTAYWIRQVIAGGYTDTHQQINSLSRMIRRGAEPVKIELLPYHAMGMEKWAEAGEEYRLSHLEPPSGDLMDQLNMRLRNSSME